MAFPYRSRAYYGKEKVTIGEGSFGKVVIVEGTHGQFAMKHINTYNIYSFIVEIALSKYLRDKSVVDIIDVFTTLDKKDNYAYVMKPAIGDVKSFVEKTVPGREAIKGMAFDMIESIAYIHSRGVLHRDIKPENFLVYRDRVKLADFGNASQYACVYKIDELMSPYLYAAPELVHPSDNFDVYTDATDVWALGVTLYNIYSRDFNSVIMDHLGPQPIEYGDLRTVPPAFKKPLSELMKNIPNQVSDFITRMVAWVPSDRPTAHDILTLPYFSDTVKEKGVNLNRLRSKTCLQQLHEGHSPERLQKYKGKKNITQVTMNKIFDFVKTFFSTRGILSFRLYFYFRMLVDAKIQTLKDEDFMVLMIIASFISGDSTYMFFSQMDVDLFVQEIVDISKELKFDLVFSTEYDFLIELYKDEVNSESFKVSVAILFGLSYDKSRYKYDIEDIAKASFILGRMHVTGKCEDIPSDNVREVLKSIAKFTPLSKKAVRYILDLQQLHHIVF